MQGRWLPPGVPKCVDEKVARGARRADRPTKRPDHRQALQAGIRLIVNESDCLGGDGHRRPQDRRRGRCGEDLLLVRHAKNFNEEKGDVAIIGERKPWFIVNKGGLPVQPETARVGEQPEEEEAQGAIVAKKEEDHDKDVDGQGMGAGADAARPTGGFARQPAANRREVILRRIPEESVANDTQEGGATAPLRRSVAPWRRASRRGRRRRHRII